MRPNNAPYSCAKFGIVGLTHTTALEGRYCGITCGCLHPGVAGDQISSKIPMIPVKEVAAAAVFMVCQPPDVNVLEITQLPRDQPYIGRG